MCIPLGFLVCAGPPGDANLLEHFGIAKYYDLMAKRPLTDPLASLGPLAAPLLKHPDWELATAAAAAASHPADQSLLPYPKDAIRSVFGRLAPVTTGPIAPYVPGEAVPSYLPSAADVKQQASGSFVKQDSGATQGVKAEVKSEAAPAPKTGILKIKIGPAQPTASSETGATAASSRKRQRL